MEQNKKLNAGHLKQIHNALERYKTNPTYCLQCNSIIKVTGKYYPGEIRKKKFCNSSCAASYNNAHYVKTPKIPKLCSRCNNPVSKRKFLLCRKCLNQETIQRYKNMTKAQATKDKSRRDCGYIIQNHAKSVLQLKKKQCVYCGYTKIIEICHIKPVKEFSNNTNLSEINSLLNLCYLCPNHHNELDKGFITPLEIQNLMLLEEFEPSTFSM